MSALFNFNSLLLVILLLICTSSYIKAQAPAFINREKKGIPKLIYKFAIIGERLSPYVSMGCTAMAIYTLFQK
ncbi:hypothetical protein BB558_001588 [Smittium angustum]|uniref:Protein kish n=1 Tax=Smittium angustum TaxID=133377 RepID=A0A2U1JBD4_SMIAN|nr:hypothetical protein BB558_001588 [Smittium angustum]